MKDQGIVLGTALGFKDPGNGYFVKSVGTKPLDGFRWNGNQPATTDDFRGCLGAAGSVGG